MIYLAATTALTLFVAALVQLSIAFYFRQQFSKKRKNALPTEHQKQVAVLMCIRGCDPTLRQSLIGILEQDFGEYTVHLVLDHRKDFAWDVVQEVKREHDLSGILRIHELNDPHRTCGLKCSALLEGLKHVNNDTKFVVLMDSDVRPHAGWLAELLGPLHDDPTVGLVTGNQWFEPVAGANWGSLFRSMWNAGALVPTAMFQNPWAGTLGMRLSDLRSAKLDEVWENSIVDDGPLRKAFEPLGLKVHFAPSLIMINREKCTLGYVNDWVSRMLTWSRIFEKTFFFSVIHAIFSNVVMLGTFIFFAIGMVTGNGMLALIPAIGLIASGILSVSAYAVVRNAVSQSAALRGEALSPIGFVRVVELFWSVAPVQLIYGWASIRAMISQEIKWRDITYRIRGKDQVEMIDYHPYEPPPHEVGSKVSI